MPPSPVVTILRGWNEKQATRAAGPPTLQPFRSEADLAADGAGGVLDDWQIVGARNGQNRGQIARHSHLVDAQYGSRAPGDGSIQGRRVHVVAVG